MSGERPFLKKTFAQVVEDMLAELRSGRNDRMILDDGTEGSVLRTLVEAFGRELAIAYEQLEHVYEAGYLDTATGASLDKVVGLLGVERLQAGWIEGDVVFARASPAPYRIEIPQGTLVSGKKLPVFETRTSAVLEVGQRQVEVPVRSIEPVGVTVEPERITVLHRPLAGIDGVGNPKVLQPRREPESDAELRERVRNTIRGGLTATVSALERTVLELGLTEVEIVEYPERPGVVDVVLAEEGLSESLLEEIRRRIEEVRPAGVRVHVYEATSVWLRLRASVRLEQVESPQGRAALGAALEGMVREHVASQRVGQSVRWGKIRNLIAADPRVAEVELVAGEWPLVQVDENGAPLTDPELVATARTRLSGEVSQPEAVFIGTSERARVASHGVELTLLDPEPPVWIDVEAERHATADEATVRVAIASALAVILPDRALLSSLSYTYEQLRAALADIDGLVLTSLRFLVLYSSNGRVLLLDQNDPAGSDDAQFAIGERVFVRNVRLVTAGGEAR